MIITLIAAMAENRVIGNKRMIPWNIPSDMKRFREITMGHSILLGRVTFESIGYPLPGRRNIVLTRRHGYRAEGITVVHSLEEAFSLCKSEDEVFICGGGTVFDETIGLAGRIYLSLVHRNYEGDTFFPPVPGSFSEISREEIEDTPPYSFIRYERRG
jgi:dihydrofolate reductase